MVTEQELSAVLNGMRLIDECPIEATKSKPGNNNVLQHWRWPIWSRRERTLKKERLHCSSTANDAISSQRSTTDEDLIGEYAIESESSPKTVLDDAETSSPIRNNIGKTAAISDVVGDDSQRGDSIIQTIADDFRPGKGDQKILRAIGRTASVNAAVLLTAVTGGAAAATGVGMGVGGAITAKRAAAGIVEKDEREVVKSLSVFGAATGASIGAQAVTGAVLIGLGAALPVAAAVAFGAGCTCGITAGALSEWAADGVIDKVKRKKTDTNASNIGRSESNGAVLQNRNLKANDHTTEHIFRRSKSHGIPARRKRPSKRKDVPKHPTLKRCHSDGLIANFDKWYKKRSDLPRRNSCVF